MDTYSIFSNLDLQLNELKQTKIEKVLMPDSTKNNEQRVVNMTSNDNLATPEPPIALAYCYKKDGQYYWEVLKRYKLNKLRDPDGNVFMNNHTITNIGLDTSIGHSAATVDYVKSYASGMLFKGVVVAFTNDPPDTPINGDKYIIGTEPTGIWAGKENQIATYTDQWNYELPENGWTYKNEDDDHLYIFSEDLDDWIDFGTSLNYNAGDGIDIDGNIISVKLTSETYSGLDFVPADQGLRVKTFGVITKRLNGVGLLHNCTQFEQVGGANGLELTLSPDIIYAPAGSSISVEYKITGVNKDKFEIDINTGDGVETVNNLLKVKLKSNGGLVFENTSIKINYDENTLGISGQGELYVKTAAFTKTAVKTWTQVAGEDIYFKHDLDNASPLVQTFVLVDGNYFPCIMNYIILSNVDIRLYPLNAAGKNFKVVIMG